MRGATLAALGALILLSGCATQHPISANPIQDVTAASPVKLTGALSIEDGLKEAAFNLDGAVSVGALDASDPAPACVHSVMKDLGLEGTAATPSFVPQESTVLGRGAVLYIRLRQAQKLSGSGVTIPTGCDALIGKFVIDVGRANASSLPGGGILPKIR